LIDTIRRIREEEIMAKKVLARRSDVDAATVLPLPSSEGGGYLASAVELPGCVATGETEVEALEELRDAIRSWIKTAREFGDEVPPKVSV
jgi:predicted RNase H-like HicB family nuclease